MSSMFQSQCGNIKDIQTSLKPVLDSRYGRNSDLESKYRAFSCPYTNERVQVVNKNEFVIQWSCLKIGKFR